MLYLRILSALVGIPIVIGSVYLGGPWYALLLLLVVNLAIYEYSQICKNKGYLVFPALSHIVVTLLIFLVFLEEYNLILTLIMLTLLILFSTVLFNMNRFSIIDAALSLWGIIYLGVLFGYMLLLRMLPGGDLYTYMLLAGVWLHDTMAYFIGVKWGFNKLATTISPNKSVEGSLAGIGGTLILFFSAAILYPNTIPLSPLQAVILALGISVFAQLGDLMESALKRQLEIKDSGSIIPGHGGIMDRFDSLLVAAPFVYYFFVLIQFI